MSGTNMSLLSCLPGMADLVFCYCEWYVSHHSYGWTPQGSVFGDCTQTQMLPFLQSDDQQHYKNRCLLGYISRWKS
jgi:hypothetical protein